MQPVPNEKIQKAEFIKELKAQNVVAIGNGRNDAMMLQLAKIGIIILGKEGCAVEALLKANIAIPSIEDALKLILRPSALKATLRL